VALRFVALLRGRDRSGPFSRPILDAAAVVLADRDRVEARAPQRSISARQRFSASVGFCALRW
jgi:hypothetical protein